MEKDVNADYEQPNDISPILWQNSDRTVILFDIPHSIARAQGDRGALPFQCLVSSPPLLAPFPANEPKSASAKAKLENNSVDAELHAEYVKLLERALSDMKNNHDGACCLARPFVEDRPRAAKKRKLESSADNISISSSTGRTSMTAKLPSLLLPSIAKHDGDGMALYNTELVCHPVGSNHSWECSANKDLETGFFSNESDHTTLLKRTSNTNGDNCIFKAPRKSSFSIGDCAADSNSFRVAVFTQAQRVDTRKQFDFILLDPPWPNKSVKRTHKTVGSTYAISSSLQDIRSLIFDTDVDILMADECLVGMWITNKAAVRDLILGENGIFACWGVQLVEEWVWLKTTARGEPVTPLDALWRKPYEVLLLGRKRQTMQTQEPNRQSDAVVREIKRRVIVGVPDLHSRKPCLKELIESLMPNKDDYRALEVFARHLVAGWWSWGDECIKFNWEGFWRKSPNGATESVCIDESGT